jgi:hypothetical protein
MGDVPFAKWRLRLFIAELEQFGGFIAKDMDGRSRFGET